MVEIEVIGAVTTGLSRDDCRCIEQLLCVDPDGQKHEVRTSQAYFDLKGSDTYYLTADGERHKLEPVTKFNSRYVRALSEDSPDDPLLSLPSPSERTTARS